MPPADHAIDAPPSPNTPPLAVTTAVGILWGTIGFALMDLWMGYDLGRFAGSTAPRTFGIVTLTLANAGLVGVTFSAIAALALGSAGLRPGATKRRFWIASCGVPLAGLLVFFVGEIVGTHRFRSLPYSDVAATATRIAAALSSFAALWIAAAVIPRCERLAPTRWALRVVAVACAFFIARVNARLFVGQYSRLHLMLSFATVALLVIGVGRPLALLRIGRRLAAAVVVAAIVVAFVIERTPAARSLNAAMFAAAPATRDLLPWTSQVFRLARPVVKATRIEITSEDAASRAATKDRIRAELRDVLGAERRFNVLIISLDAVRHDHVGFMGYRRPTTPNIDDLVRHAFVFERAWSTYPTSRFAYASLLTGLVPHATPTDDVIRRGAATPMPEVTWPRLMAKNGWATIARTSFNKMSAGDPRQFATLSSGFEDYEASPSLTYSSAREVTDQVLAALARNTERPFFLWAHYFDPHDSYDKQPGFDFGDDDIARYDSEIAGTDAQIHRLIEQLRIRGEFADTIIIIHSDHGDAFGEHGSFFHDSTLYEEQIRVPLAIVVPYVEGHRVATPVSLVDLMPTVVDLLELDDEMTRHGTSLLEAMFTKTSSRPPLYAEFFGSGAMFSGSPARAVIDWPLKMIHRTNEDLYELYDLAADPLELTNLIGRDAARDAGLAAALEALSSRGR